MGKSGDKRTQGVETIRVVFGWRDGSGGEQTAKKSGFDKGVSYVDSEIATIQRSFGVSAGLNSRGECRGAGSSTGLGTIKQILQLVVTAEKE